MSNASGEVDLMGNPLASPVVDLDESSSEVQVEVVDDILTIVGYNKEQEIQSLPFLRKIKVTVNWNENDRERRLSLETQQAMMINP